MRAAGQQESSTWPYVFGCRSLPAGPPTVPWEWAMLVRARLNERNPALAYVGKRVGDDGHYWRAAASARQTAPTLAGSSSGPDARLGPD